MVCSSGPDGLGHAALVGVWQVGEAQLASGGRIASVKCPPSPEVSQLSDVNWGVRRHMFYINVWLTLV